MKDEKFKKEIKNIPRAHVLGWVKQFCDCERMFGGLKNLTIVRQDTGYFDVEVIFDNSIRTGEVPRT